MSIQTNILSIDIPSPIEKDRRGVKIKEGLKIAYNRSGNICVGVIREIRKNEYKIVRLDLDNKKWYHLNFEMIVDGEDGKMSNIKNANSFIII